MVILFIHSKNLVAFVYAIAVVLKQIVVGRRLIKKKNYLICMGPIVNCV